MTTSAKKNSFDLDCYLSSRRKLVESELKRYLEVEEPEILWQSMSYSVLSPGKRIRALLCLAAFETIKISCGELKSINTNNCQNTFEVSEHVMASVLPCACAIEMIHAMSLIHDDLPCLDNDDLRRGMPTNHTVFGEAVALLAGDALLMKAIEIIISSASTTLSANDTLAIALGLCRATGAHGMVGGQVFDLIHTGDWRPGSLWHTQFENKDSASTDSTSGKGLDDKLSIVEKIHAGKTASLIKFSLWSGAHIAGANQEQLVAISKFGEILGLAFQITDDLLDITGTADSLGKTPGKDQACNKATWTEIFGIDGSRRKLQKLEEEARFILKESALWREDFPVLESLLSMSIHRQK